MSYLFQPLQMREVTVKNRIFVSPMCQYSAPNHIPNHWHLVHLGSRAVGGAGLVMCEATAVAANACISRHDVGIWNESQVLGFSPIVDFIHQQGSVAGIQLAHAGRKAGSRLPWENQSLEKEKQVRQPQAPLGPSAVAFSSDFHEPHPMSEEDMEQVILQFTQATKRSIEAGFKVLEIHMAHGYLLHEFLSPLSNFREDRFGGSLENRMRFPLLLVEEVRKNWPSQYPLFVRISATDWMDERGWDLSDSLILGKKLKDIGVDFIDCSSGGNIPNAKIPISPGYQVGFSEKIRSKVKILTGAVGLITNPQQAEDIIATEKADAVFLGREFLRNPYWPLHAANILHHSLPWPLPYARAHS